MRKPVQGVRSIFREPWETVWTPTPLVWVKIVFQQFDSEVNSVAIGNPERHVRKASHCGSKQQ